MPNLQEIKARREKINGASWKAVEGNSNDIRSSVFAGNDLLATLSSWKRHEYAVFIANAPTDIDWLVQEVERLKAEKAQAEAERDTIATVAKELSTAIIKNPLPVPMGQHKAHVALTNVLNKIEAQQQAEKQGGQE